MTKPKAMVIPINNMSQSGHHRLIIRLRIDMAAESFASTHWGVAAGNSTARPIGPPFTEW
jgi:hypothetical protein